MKPTLQVFYDRIKPSQFSEHKKIVFLISSNSQVFKNHIVLVPISKIRYFRIGKRKVVC